MDDNEESLPSSSASHSANAILQAGERVEQELMQIRKELEEKTRQLDNALTILRATMESASHGILVTDETGLVLRFNERYLRMWNIHPSVMDTGQHRILAKFCCKHIADPQRFLNRMKEIYETWPPETSELLELSDGRTFEGTSKIQYADGRSIGRIWSFRDVTARRRAEEALRDSNERLFFMADAMPQKIFTARPDGDVDYVNQQWRDYTGLVLEQIAGWEWIRLIHAEEAGECIRLWRHSLATGEPFRVECRFRRAAGDYRWHLIQARAKRDARGNITMWVGSNTDIHSIKQADEEKKQLLENERIARSEAERANHTKDEFLATLSHELRTPLNAILGWSQLILQGTMKVDNVRRGIETIERNARAQNKLIEDLLEMTSIMSGKVRLDMQQVDIASIVDAAIQSIMPAAEAKGIRILDMTDRTDAADRSARLISGDQSRLQQIVWNLLSNAVKFTPPAGTVEATVERKASCLEIIVKDSGIGIKPEFLGYVFDRFRQADSSLTRRHGGLGLGLAIVKQLVELHNGTVRAESDGEGKGASFIVALPLPAGNTETMSGPYPPSPPYRRDRGKDTFSGMKILVIDDEADARDFICEVLVQCEAEVIAAASALEGIEILKNRRPDIVISDIGMPEKDGHEFIREIRSLSAMDGGETPAIALSAFAHSDDRARAVLAGYHIHLAKPVESRELIAAIGNLIACTSREPADKPDAAAPGISLPDTR